LLPRQQQHDLAALRVLSRSDPGERSPRPLAHPRRGSAISKRGCDVRQFARDVRDERRRGRRQGVGRCQGAFQLRSRLAVATELVQDPAEQEARADRPFRTWSASEACIATALPASADARSRSPRAAISLASTASAKAMSGLASGWFARASASASSAISRASSSFPRAMRISARQARS
jgi:hypothetical protein